MTDDEVIQDAIELETSSCNCRNHFRGNRIDEGKYRVGKQIDEGKYMVEYILH